MSSKPCDMLPAFHWHDERVGIWTDVEEIDGAVIVRLRKTHARGPIIGGVLIAFVAYFFVRGGVQHGNGIASYLFCTAVSLIIGMLATVSLRSKTLLQSFPLAILDNASTGVDANCRRSLHSKNIQSVIARENIGRWSNDQKRFQIYLDIAGEEYAELIHQDHDYGERRDRVLTKAKSLADRREVPLIVGDEMQSVGA